ncbi:MAG TPA: hypothetical protein VK360_00060 [Acidimicrobiales bacterium]|nr:hypothetical protein [Acidimicrobiales bacterium]
MDFLLVHSPLVGPTTWRWVAAALSEAGHDAIVPDLRSSAVTGRPRSFVDEAVSSTPSDWFKPVVVGHSGAGFLVPSIVERLDAAHAVFVDAGLPPDDSPATAGADIVDRLRVLAVDGTLPKWSTWWGPDAMRALIPDDTRRAQVDAELPEVPIAFYELTVELPTDWPRRSSSFLLLSEAYRADADRARSLGWSLTERLGGHLDIVSAPEAVAPLIVDLARGTGA